MCNTFENLFYFTFYKMYEHFESEFTLPVSTDDDDETDETDGLSGLSDVRNQTRFRDSFFLGIEEKERKFQTQC